jgi:hypothetical protein
MAFSVEYDETTEIILVRISGHFDLRVLKNLAVQVGKATQKYGCCRILNDLRQAEITKDAFNIYNMPKTAQKSGVEFRCKRALVVMPGVTDFNFLETVFVNQGHIVKLFTDIDTATAWLSKF